MTAKDLKLKNQNNALIAKKGASNGRGGGGSALRRLKMGMLDAGLLGRHNQSSNKKTGKKTNDVSRAANIDSQNLIRRKVALDKLRNNNPFEMQHGRTKHEVLGRSVKGIQGRPGASRKVSLLARSTAIRKELYDNKKAGSFIDQRIGEKSSDMPHDQKMNLRWTNEKQHQSKRLSRKSAFNLNNLEGDNDDGEFKNIKSRKENNVGLTHFGRSLDAPGVLSSDDDGENGPNHGYAEQNDPFVRELLAESNFGGHPDDRKRSRAEIMREVVATAKKRKAERQQLIVDNEELRLQTDAELPNLLSILSQKKVLKRYNISDSENEEKDDTKKINVDGENNKSVETQEDQYDTMINQLRYEKRVVATDRVKSEEELAYEARKKLENLELERLQRMAVCDQSDDDDDDKKSVSSIESEKETPKKKIKVSNNDVILSELPFKFEAPTSQIQFDKLMNDLSGIDIAMLLKRLRVLYHPSLAEGNKGRIAHVFGFLLDYLWRRNLGEFDVLEFIKPIYGQILELSKIYPLELGQWISRSLVDCMAEPLIKIFTGIQLTMLRCIVRIFSASDFYNAAITPLLICCAAYLSQPKTSVCDISCGLYITGICLESQRISKRWIPECFNFLSAILSSFPDELNYNTEIPFPSWFDGIIKEEIIESINSKNEKIDEYHRLPTDPFAINQNEKGIRIKFLICAIRLIREAANIYSENPLSSYPETFGVLPNLLKKQASLLLDLKDNNNFASELYKICIETAEFILEKSNNSSLKRQPTLMQMHRPVPIVELEPDFDTNYSLDRKGSSSAENEVAKLRGLVKREKRGAIRELRRDAEYLNTLRLAERKTIDAEYAIKIKKIMGTIGNEAGGHKQMEREVERAKSRQKRK